MTRLIDADALTEKYTVVIRKAVDEKLKTEIAVLLKDIEDAPTIDAVPVRHGKWIWKGEDGDSRFMCSVCKRKEYVPTCNGVPDIWNYCPSCGARME